jgi:hypothetical protein
MSDADNEDFGRVALRLGLCTAAQIERCRRIQSSTDERLSLGQSLLREGFLSGEQFSKVLETQRTDARKRASALPSAPRDCSSRRRMSCPACIVSFSVPSFAGSVIVPCPRCRRPLDERIPAPGPRTSDPHAAPMSKKALTPAPVFSGR